MRHNVESTPYNDNLLPYYNYESYDYVQEKMTNLYLIQNLWQNYKKSVNYECVIYNIRKIEQFLYDMVKLNCVFRVLMFFSIKFSNFAQ